MPKTGTQVRFEGPEDVEEEKNSIEVHLEPPNTVQISLGILKSYHRYRIEALIPNSILDGLVNPKEDLQDGLTPNIMLQSFDHDSFGLNVIVEISTDEQLTLEETLTFGKNLINFTASVLGPHKGTPYLRKNIHLLAKIPHADSSDED